MLRAGDLRKDASGRGALRVLVIPRIEIVVFVLRIAVLVRVGKGLEPLTAVGGMVDREVQNHEHIALMADIEQLEKIVRRAELRVDLVVVCHIVFMIRRRREDRRQPKPLHAERLARIRIAVVQVVHSVHNALDIADPVPVRVRERADKDFIEHAVVILDRGVCRIARIRNDKFAVVRRRRCGIRFGGGRGGRGRRIGCGGLAAAERQQQQRDQQKGQIFLKTVHVTPLRL